MDGRPDEHQAVTGQAVSMSMLIIRHFVNCIETDLAVHTGKMEM